MRALVAAALLWLMAGPALADARMTVLVDLLGVQNAAQIMRAEGMDHAQELNTDMLGGQGGPGWEVQVEVIYDTGRMVEQVRRALEEHLTTDTLEAAIAFYASDLGRQIVTLENTARAAISHPDVEAAARTSYADIEGSDAPRLAQITALVENGDMINRNVTNALNANFEFMRGLRDGDALRGGDEELLGDVTADIDSVTQDTVSWLYGYMLMAYSPLDADDLSGYVAFSNTDAGRAVNAALFDGFGQTYEDISYALGRAVAMNMTAQDL